jgi:predicted anti-sigma-YlaC factor YlaD
MTRQADNEYAQVRCEDIRESLFDYLTQELGEGSSDLVRIHLRRCETCRQTAAGLKATLDLLRESSHESGGIPTRLSEERYARLIRAVMHPVLDWMYRHHILVSFIAAVAILLTVLFILRGVNIWRREILGPSYPVIIEEGHADGSAWPGSRQDAPERRAETP